jgi:energy-coupling factor transport system permease protein
MFRLAKVRFSDMKLVLVLVTVFFIINNVVTFLFAPEHGVIIYGTRHELFHIAGRYYMTSEALFYHLNLSLKYFAIVPIALVFFLTTDPSEFASSLNTLKVNYKVAYAVSLTLRYIPDVQRSYREISQAQQARGVKKKKKAPIRKRLVGILAILFPLVFSSMDRIELISNAMELRGFGRLKKRTWYSYRPFSKWDIVVVIVGLLYVALSVFTIIINNGRFYNPFS